MEWTPELEHYVDMERLDAAADAERALLSSLLWWLDHRTRGQRAVAPNVIREELKARLRALGC